MGDFDRFKDTYEAQLDEVIRFSGQDRTFFTRAKTRWIRDIVQRHLGAPHDLSALDVGCGVGLTISESLGEFGSLAGVDISAAMIERAKERAPAVDFRVYDGTRLPYDDASFDVAYTVCVLHHVPLSSRFRFVAEMQRVLRPGGLALIGEHNPWNPLTRLAVYRCAFDEDARLLRMRESEELLRSSHLDVVERRYILVAPFASSIVERVERALSSVPLGAQYLVAGMRAAGI